MAKRVSEPVVLTSDDVSIATASVTLKVIQVNNRQMTQSVFKQLPTIELFDPQTLELSGLIWGWVNFGLRSNLNQNFVVQREGMLYRSEFCVLDFCDLKRELAHSVHGYTRSEIVHPFKGEGRYTIFNKLRASGVYTDRWNNLMDQLRNVDQLYIAA